MKEKTSFSKLIQYWGIIMLMGIGGSIIVLDIVSTYRDFSLRAGQMRTDYTARQKQIIKQEVERVVNMIHYERAQSEVLARKQIKSRVHEAHSIARHIFQQNKSAKSGNEIKKMIIDALKPIRFGQGRGYYFISRLDGVAILFPSKPEWEGLNLLDVQDTHGQYLAKDMIHILRQSGEGFYEYHWTKPHAEGSGFKKTSFIKWFEPYDWFFGAGLYVDDIEDQIKGSLLSAISRIRFGKEGYIFINRLNGDALVSNGKLFSGTKKLWEVFDKNPEEMKNIFKKEYNAALKPEGDYISYSHIKLTDPSKKSPKTSFIYGIPEWQWLVGAGVYLDDVETDIALMQTKLNNQIKAKIFYFTLITAGIVAFSLFLFSWLNRRLKKDFNLFISFFNRAVTSDEPIDRALVQFDELDRMAKNANQMLSDRRQAEEALQESEERFRVITNSALDAVVEIDPDGNVAYWNPAAEQIFGHKHGELIGKNVHDHLMPKQYRDRFIKGFKTFRKTGSGPAVGKVLELTAIHKNGHEVPVEMAVSPIEKQGEYWASAIIRDISARKQSEEALRKSEEKLVRSKKMESLGLLAGGVAHDLNNVLSGIVSYPELLLMDMPEDSKLRKPIETMQESGHRAVAIVQDLLTVARGAASTKEPLNLNDIISEYLKSPEFKKLERFHPSVTVKTSLDTELFNIGGSHVHIRKAVMNLVSNSAEAIETSGNVTISTMNRYVDKPLRGYDDVNTGEYAILSVSDDGPGISADDLERIFEPFYTKKVMGRSGTGLGLAVVWNVVQDHEGYIDVKSDENGTKFQLYFPITRDEVSDEELSVHVEDIKGDGERILVVDDMESQREISCKMLNTLGYKAIAVSSGEEAVEYLRESSADLILLDMIMDPGINGRETYERIIKIHPNQKAIIISGFAETDEVKEAQNLGAGKYVKKPITLEKIGLAVKEELEK